MFIYKMQGEMPRFLIKQGEMPRFLIKMSLNETMTANWAVDNILRFLDMILFVYSAIFYLQM